MSEEARVGKGDIVYLVSTGANQSVGNTQVYLTLAAAKAALEEYKRTNERFHRHFGKLQLVADGMVLQAEGSNRPAGAVTVRKLLN